MKIVNKVLKTNYNVSTESYKMLIFKWITIFIWLFISLFILFIFLAHILVNFISLEQEKKILWWFPKNEFNVLKEETQKLRTFLWKDFKYEIFVVNMEEENAFALPWWIIVLTNSLLKNIKYENSLIFILWHEIWHIENRDVFKMIVSEMPLKIIIWILWFSADIDLSFLLSWTSAFYTKTVENKADIVGVEYLNNKKWNTNCLLYFFEKNNWVIDNITTFLSDHPMSSWRINYIKEYVKHKSYSMDNEKCKLLDINKK